MWLSNNVIIIRSALLVLIAYCACACKVTNVPQNSNGTFLSDSVFISSGDTLLVKYDEAAHKVGVFTKNYYREEDSIRMQIKNKHITMYECDVMVGNIKMAQPYREELRRNGIKMLSETALSSVLSEERSCGWFTVYFIFSLSKDDFQDYGFTLTWYKPDILLTATDIESVLSFIRQMQFHNVAKEYPIDKICMKFITPVEIEPR